MKITLFPGEYIIDPENGHHICDENGFAIKTDEQIDIELTLQNEEKINNIVTLILENRIREGILFGDKEESVWFVVEKNKQYKSGELVKMIGELSSNEKLYKIKETLCLCDKTCGQLINNDIQYNIPMQNKKQIKKKKIEEKNPVMQKINKIIEVDEIVFDEIKQIYIKKKVEKNTEIEEQIIEQFPLYDDSENPIGTHGVPKFETIITETNVLDEQGEIVYEDVLNENGEPIQEYIIPTKFLLYDSNNTFTEIKEEEFDENNQNHFKAIYIKILIK